MNGIRKVFVVVFCALLLASLIGLAAATSSNVNLKSPEKLKDWLASSKLYDNFIGNASNLAEQSTGSDQAGSVSLSDTAVIKAAQSAFPADFLKQNVETFINSNYEWLQGKTDKPDFKIDLTDAKNNFATKVGQYVTAYTANLPVCTTAQESQAQTADPLTAVCRPTNTSAEQLGAQVTSEIQNGDFLANSVITADNFSPKKNADSQAYYRKLSRLPQAYQLGTNMPYVFGALSLISALAVVLLSVTRRKGFKKSAWIFTVAGVVLVSAKFSSDVVFNQLEKRAFNNSTIGQLQHSLTDFARSVESAFTKTEMYFGIAYLAIAIIIFVILFFTRDKKDLAEEPVTKPKPTQTKATPAPSSKPTTTPTPKPALKPRPVKKPRLIQ